MELVIQNSDQLNMSADFITYLINVISFYFTSSEINFTRFSQEFQNLFSPYSANIIPILAGKNLIVNNYDTYLIIEINPNKYLKGSSIRLLDLCKLLNNGTLDVPGTCIFSDTFDYVAKNLNQIYLGYILEM